MSTNILLVTGIYQSFAALGAAIGFMVGGQLLNIYVDTDREDASKYGTGTHKHAHKYTTPSVYSNRFF